MTATAAQDRWPLDLTIEQLNVIEMLTAQEIEWGRRQMSNNDERCPRCQRNEGIEEHAPDCLWLAACQVHSMIDTA